MWTTEKDRPALLAALREARRGASLAEQRRQAARVHTSPVKAKCASIRLATWAALYGRYPESDEHWSEGDAMPTAKAAATAIDALRASVREYLIDEADAQGDAGMFTREAERLERALKALDRKTERPLKSASNKNDNGSLF